MHFVQEYPPMSMNSLSFLFVFLPLALLAFALTPRTQRRKTLLVISIAYYFFAQPMWLLPMLALAVSDYGALRLMGRWRGNLRARWLCAACSIGKNGLCTFLGAAFVQIREDTRYFPLGLLVYCISAAGVVAEAYREEDPIAYSPVNLGVYLLFFPRLYAGPLISYREFELQLVEMRLDWRKAVDGGGLFVLGAFKYTVFGRSLYRLYGEMKGMYPGEATVLSTWCMVFFLALALYYILSGYCDMARGLGQVFGIKLPINFYYPYQSRSITDFFQRFNITLHALLWKLAYGWLRREENSLAVEALNLGVVGMLAGAWFGLRVNYLLWGVYLMAFLLMEKHLYPGVLRNLPVLLCRVYTLCVVLTGFTILAGDSLGESIRYLFHMFRLGSHSFALYDGPVLYLLSSNWLLLATGCFFATSAASLAVAALRKAAPKTSTAFLGLFNLGVLGFLVALSL